MNSKFTPTHLTIGLATTNSGPFWLWPNLLSLDAPLIAVLWQNIFALDAHVGLTAASRIALGSSVWLIYLVDRLLDTANGAASSARHRFCLAHRAVYCALAGVALSVLTISIFRLPPAVVKTGFITAGLVAIYLFLVHSHRPLPKEAVVALVFSIGTGLAPFTRAFDQWQVVFPASLFGVLLWVNASAIEVWEGGKVDAASEWMVRHMKTVATLVCLSCLFLPEAHHSAAALLITSVGLWAIADMRTQFSPNGLRVGLDGPLLSPLFLIR